MGEVRVKDAWQVLEKAMAWHADPARDRLATADELLEMQQTLERLSKGHAVAVMTCRSGWAADHDSGARGFGGSNIALAVKNLAQQLAE